MEWISVKDKLPTDGYPILLCCKWSVGIGYYIEGEGFETEKMDDFPESADITHWMPLPEPPKQ